MILMLENNSFFQWLEHSQFLHGPFFVAMGGWLLTMVVLWGFQREIWKSEKKSWANELKDEGWIMFIVILLSIVLDDQVMYLHFLVMTEVFNRELEQPIVLIPEHYMAIAPVTAGLYMMGKAMYLKVTKK